MGYYIKMKTIDDLIISLDVEIARKSSVICEIMENLGIEDPEGKLDETKLEKEFVPVPIHSTILYKIIEWYKHHKNDPKIERGDDDDDR